MRHRARVGEGAAGLGRAADHPAVAVALRSSRSAPARACARSSRSRPACACAARARRRASIARDQRRVLVPALRVTPSRPGAFVGPVVRRDRLDHDRARRAGTCASIHARVEVARVGAREHERPSGRCRRGPARAAPPRRSSRAARRAHAAHRARRAAARERSPQQRSPRANNAASRHSDREDRQQPAPEVAALQAHEDEEQQRRRHEHPAEPAVSRATRQRAAERRERRHPAEPPGERPQVVDDARPRAARRACPALRPTALDWCASSPWKRE